MKLHDDLLSVLSFGWECTRKAWRLVAAKQLPAPESIGATGRDLDQLAYDLRRFGFGKPARLAFSAAFVLNGLAAGTIQFDRELAENTSQIISVLAEMLLELEANSQVTAEEPADIVEDLQLRWGLVLYVEDQASSRTPRPHFHRHPGEIKPVGAVMPASLLNMCEELVTVSESLLNRVIQDGDFPDATTLGRIHHLGTAIRDCVAASSATPPEQAIDSKVSEVITVSELTPLPAPVEVPEQETRLPSVVNRGIPESVEMILIIDGSPFFRMLLTTAIEAAGYPVRAVADLTEAKPSFGIWSLDMVICSTDVVSATQEWLGDSLHESRTTLIVLASEKAGPSDDADTVLKIPRTDLAGLLQAVKAKLGPALNPVRLSA
jgi:hypothetical protein